MFATTYTETLVQQNNLQGNAWVTQKQPSKTKLLSLFYSENVGLTKTLTVWALVEITNTQTHIHKDIATL